MKQTTVTWALVPTGVRCIAAICLFTLVGCGGSSSGGPTCTACEEGRLPQVEWRRSLVNGSRDGEGNVLTGTEIRSLVAFDGKLFASSGIWMDPDVAAADQPGPQVFVLDRSENTGGRWRLDFELSERLDLPGQRPDGFRRYVTVSVLAAVRLETDAKGEPLDEPVSLLLAGAWDRHDATNIWVRTVRGEWTEVALIEGAQPPVLVGPGVCARHVRSFVAHRDAETGVDLVFAGTSGGDDVDGCPALIFSGVYDPDSPGGLRWAAEPEPWFDPPNPYDRVTSMAAVGGKLYATVCGKVFERVDGATPGWRLAYAHPDDFCPAGPGENGFRGATPIPCEAGDCLLLSMEGWRPNITRLELDGGIVAHQELDTDEFLATSWNTPVGYAIVAYDTAARFELPGGKWVTLLGLEASTPLVEGNWNFWHPHASYLVRSESGTYELRRISDPTIEDEPPLVSTRTMLASPFPEDAGRVIYAGGFDANGKTADDTAWLYRGELVLD